MSLPTAASPEQKRRYFARVKDHENNHPLHGDDWWIVTTRANPEGMFAARAWAENALERAKSNYPHGRLIGHVDSKLVDVEPTLESIKVDMYLRGDVKPVKSVPAQYRAAYRDTLARAALAAYRYGEPIWINESFRTRAEQQAFWDKFLAGGPLAARPGTSKHEVGLALDIPNARSNKRLIKHLRAVGLMDDVPSEGWHVANHALRP